MPTDKQRYMVTLDHDTSELLCRLQQHIKLSPAQIIQKLLPSHQLELWAYLDWLEKLPKDKSLQADLGPFLIHSYGPDSLIDSIKKLDPTYQFESEKFKQSMKE